MYETFYGFDEKPFSLLPDPAFLYLGRQHSNAYSLLQYAVLSQAGFTVITGEVGCGKTTLIRHLLNQLTDEVTVGLITNTANARDNLLKWVLRAFRQDYKNKDPVELHEIFEDFLIAEYGHGRRTALIVDEAQNLPIDTLEELRLLSNINADKDQVLQLILVGQPELKTKLELPDLQQFAQRVVVNYHLSALNQQEVPRYIQHRLERAGAEAPLFSDAACDLVHQSTDGVPRLINALCDMALVYGYAERVRTIDDGLVQTVIDDRAGGIRPTRGSPQDQNQPPTAGNEPAIVIFDRNMARELFNHLRKK
jgi:general secretion pathway protein A